MGSVLEAGSVRGAASAWETASVWEAGSAREVYWGRSHWESRWWYRPGRYRFFCTWLFRFQWTMYTTRSSVSIRKNPPCTSTSRSSMVHPLVRSTGKASATPSSSACIPRS